MHWVPGNMGVEAADAIVTKGASVSLDQAESVQILK